MDHVKKYALVPEDLINKHVPSKEHMSDLDRDMHKILTSSLSEDEKVKLYYELLQKKLHLAEYNTPIVKVPAEEKVESSEGDVNESFIIKSVPKNLKRYAENLIEVLKKNKSVVSWDTKNGELIVKNQRLEGTNISDLFYMLFRNTHRNFPGKTTFMKVLKEIKVPRYLIRNTYLEDTPEPSRSRRRQPSPAKDINVQKTLPVKKKLKWETYK